MKEEAVMPSPISFRHQAMGDICDALGLKMVRSLVFSCDLESPATVTVERLVTDEEAHAIHRVLSSHNLVVDDGEVWEDELLVSGEPAYTRDDDFKKYVS